MRRSLVLIGFLGVLVVHIGSGLCSSMQTPTRTKRTGSVLSPDAVSSSCLGLPLTPFSLEKTLFEDYTDVDSYLHSSFSDLWSTVSDFDQTLAWSYMPALSLSSSIREAVNEDTPLLKALFLIQHIAILRMTDMYPEIRTILSSEFSFEDGVIESLILWLDRMFPVLELRDCRIPGTGRLGKDRYVAIEHCVKKWLLSREKNPLTPILREHLSKLIPQARVNFLTSFAVVIAMTGEDKRARFNKIAEVRSILHSLLESVDGALDRFVDAINPYFGYMNSCIIECIEK